MKNFRFPIAALFLIILLLLSCEGENAEPVIKSEEETQTLPTENFISSFEQVISGPYAWYWEFEHSSSDDKIILTEVNQALFGEFGKKSILKYSHTYDSNGNIDYSLIEEGNILNGGQYYVYELNDDGYISSIEVKDVPNGIAIYKWWYTYDENNRIISRYVEDRLFSSLNNTQKFIYNENDYISTWTIEKEIDNSIREASFFFNDQNQVIRIIDFNKDEALINYTNSDKIFTISESSGNNNYDREIEYTPDSLTIDTYINNDLRSTVNFGVDMKYRNSISYNYRYQDAVLDFIIEGFPEDGGDIVANEKYLEKQGAENFLLGSSSIDWGIDVDRGIDVIRGKNIYDSEGNLIFIYETVGNGGVWFDTNEEMINDLSVVPEWARNLAAFYSNSYEGIDLFTAKSYTTLTY